ncbi:MAG: hypothetical protein AB7V50_05820 [Vampirovibrionia bacterium]
MALNTSVFQQQMVGSAANVNFKDIQTAALHLFRGQPILNIRKIQKSRLRYLMKISDVSRMITLEVFKQVDYHHYCFDELAVIKFIYSTPHAGVGVLEALLEKTKTKSLSRKELSVIKDILKAQNILKGFIKAILAYDGSFSSSQISAFSQIFKDAHLSKAVIAFFLDNMCNPSVSHNHNRFFQEIFSCQDAGINIARAINLRYSESLMTFIEIKMLKTVLNSEDLCIGIAKEIVAKSSFAVMNPIMQNNYKRLFDSVEIAEGICKGLITQLRYNVLYHHTNNIFAEMLSSKYAGEGMARALINYYNINKQLPAPLKHTFEVITASSEVRNALKDSLEKAFSVGDLDSSAYEHFNSLMIEH